MPFIATYLHLSVSRRVHVTCVWREKSKVHTGFLALIYSTGAGFCPVIGGWGGGWGIAMESFCQPAFRAKLGPRSGAAVCLLLLVHNYC